MAAIVLTEGDDTFPGGGPDLGQDDRIRGIGGNDAIEGRNGDDTIFGGSGNDSLRDGAGDDRVSGDSGNDRIYAGAGNDLGYGGVGNDVLMALGGNDTLYGGIGADILLAGSDGRSVLWGGGGTDFISVDSALDTVYGGAGDDELRMTLGHDAGSGAALFIGGAGVDRLSVEFDAATYFGPGVASEVVSRMEGTDLVFTVNGVDKVVGSGIEGTILMVAADASTLAGGAGTDSFFLLQGDAEVAAGAGDDRVAIYNRTTGHLTLEGGAGRDALSVQFDDSLAKSDQAAIFLDLRGAVGHLAIGALTASLTGFEFADIRGSAWGDTIHAGRGDDQIHENTGAGGSGQVSGDDLLDGGRGDDTIFGGLQDDTLLGGVGNDSLFGGADDDRLFGGLGADTLVGGAGLDVFVFNAAVDSGTLPDRIDNIFDFTTAPGTAGFEDRIDLSAIDARAGTAQNEAFEFIGTANFTAAGQIRVAAAAGGIYLLINTEGVTGTEMKICLVSFDAASIGAEDFIL